MDKTLHGLGPQSIPLAEFPTWAAERIQLHETLLARLLGEVTAMKYGLGIVMGCHPSPEKLLAAWNRARHDLVDVEMEGGLFQGAEYRAAFQEQMSYLTEVMEAAAGKDQSIGD
ncbi:hypothetical protein [Marilutibacter spongiae]|uniref:Uncharacterized protein n=1 Tax=Marilutibacter spongiae TaxID=2025720 RepID=A0A7W3Y6V8_9GAMM|nr:hypothetical protein [Lysobacter spongiae]MBB1061903.1 hypothetical protein [Lysobacter spongiae]